MKESLYSILDERESKYNEYTVSIIEEYGVKLTKAFAFIVNNDREILWEQVERYGDVSNLVYVLGKMVCKKGDMIQTVDGYKKVPIDGYRTSIRIVVTIDSLESKEPLELYQEIMKLRNYETLLSPTESYQLFNDPDFVGLLDSKKFKPYKDKISSSDISNKLPEFDLTGLTDEQIKQISMFTGTGGIN